MWRCKLCLSWFLVNESYRHAWFIGLKKKMLYTCTLSVLFTTTDLAMCSNKKSKGSSIYGSAVGFLYALPYYFFPYSNSIKILRGAVNITHIFNYFYMPVLVGCSYKLQVCTLQIAGVYPIVFHLGSGLPCSCI
jgi:hypothetical protein